MTVRTDPYRAAEPEPEGGQLRVTLDSGQELKFHCTVPAEGVLRLRQEWSPAGGPREGAPGGTGATGGSPVLLDLEDRPARLTRVPGGTEITGPGVHAVWDAGGQGLRFGGYQRFADPEADTVPFRAGYSPPCPEYPAGCWTETIHLAPDAAIYGGGESYQGIDLRGRLRRLRNTEESRAAGRDSAYLNVPLLWSDAGWGMFAHTGGTVLADLGVSHSEAARIEISGRSLDLFLIAGDGPAILRRYQELTGRPATLPEWAYGVWMSRSSYFTAEEVTATVDELERAGCPVDVVHVDEWLEESVLGTAAWSGHADRSRFPAGWSGPLAERGVRTSLWINPYVRRGTPVADELAERGFLVRGQDHAPVATDDNPDTYLLDFTNPQANAWWTARLARVLREERNSAVLADFGEEIPDHAVFADGSTGTERRNSYGLIYQDAVRESAQLVRGGDFVAISRSGTAGSQRDPAHWAGDLPSTWTGLVSTLRALLSMSLSGCSLVTHDGGGYWTPDSYQLAKKLRTGMTPDAVMADVEAELYGRWGQWAAFTPLTRFHGVGRREPTAYPEPVRGAVIAACRLRCALRRYLAEAATAALPLMRPMPLAHPGDRAARDADLQYYLGEDILVAPVLEPGGRRSLWVPPGAWTGLLGLGSLTGPGWREVTCGPEQFPAFARAGRNVADGASR